MNNNDTLSMKLEWLIPLAVAAGALVLRALLASPERVVWGDEPFYLWNALNLAIGRGYTFFNGVPDVYLTPLYPLLIAGLYLISHNLELASRLCYIVLGAALTFPPIGASQSLSISNGRLPVSASIRFGNGPQVDQDRGSPGE